MIERESEAIVMKLRNVVISNLAPAEKLKRFLEARFDIVEETIRESTTSQIISYITLDYKRLERIRTLAVAKEKGLISQMIDEGVSQGVFDPVQSRLFPGVYEMIFQGFDFCHLRSNFADFNLTAEEIRESVIHFLINTLVIKPTT